MFVAWRLLVLLHVGLTAANRSPAIYNFSELNCTSLCGLPILASGLPPSPLSDFPNQANITVNLGGECVRESQLPIGNWKKSARRFLQLISMDDTSLDCPKWNAVYRRPNETELPKSWTSRYFELFHKGRARRYISWFPISVVQPAGIAGYCEVYIDRGVVEGNRRVYWMQAEPQFAGNPLVTIGSLISLWPTSELNLSREIQPIPLHLQRNESNGCRGENCTTYGTLWLPTSTFGTSVPYKDDTIGRTKKETTEHYSIFAKWKFQQIPGVDGLMDKWRESGSDVANVAEDLSPSNIAILSLPLLMAIPPISLLEHVSSVATAWYVFATDILAALPLLIKGIELVVVYPKATLRIYSTLSLTGKKYGVYERWETLCTPLVGIAQTVGTIIILVALWFMMASSYTEFAFWRARQYRHGRLNAIDEIASDPIDEEPQQLNESQSFSSELKNDSWYARHRFHFVTGAFLGLIALFIFAIVARSGVVDIAAIIALVVFRVVGTNRFSQLLRWRFLVGIVFGFGGGPLYLMLHLKKTVRESKNWGDVSDGANLGMAALGSLLVALFGDSLRSSFLTSTLPPFHLVFAWLYGGAIVVLHAVRSLPNDRIKWRYGLNGFAAGISFGPLGIFFIRCYPETVKDSQARANFHGGLGFGVIFLLSVVNLISLFWWFIGFSPPNARL